VWVFLLSIKVVVVTRAFFCGVTLKKNVKVLFKPLHHHKSLVGSRWVNPLLLWITNLKNRVGVLFPPIPLSNGVFTHRKE
jgi:hypothetical protein